MTYHIYTDGGARPNPGPCGWGVAAYNDQGATVFEGSYGGGNGTNNIAEWKALISALGFLREVRAKDDAIIYLDSELVLKQLSGEYRIKNPVLRVLFTEVKGLLAELDTKIRYEKVIAHSGVVGNDRADSLATLGVLTQNTLEEIFIIR